MVSKQIIACLNDVIPTLENGLDTYIGENGSLLSGGQQQRVVIARAFIKNAPIVILDEATSALDNQSEAIVQKAIDNLMKDKTIFVIAHLFQQSKIPIKLPLSMKVNSLKWELTQNYCKSKTVNITNCMICNLKNRKYQYNNGQKP